MNINRDYSRLNAFLNARRSDIGMWFNFDKAHNGISKLAIDKLAEFLPPGARILEVGPGSGRDMIRFKKLGFSPVGAVLSLDNPLLQNRIDKYSLEVHEMDQNFMSFEPESFDGIYARHVLEHSVMPYFTLTEYNRVLKLGGIGYIEVPLPTQETFKTTEFNENHVNHYSVMGEIMVKSLLERSGFEVLLRGIYNLVHPDTNETTEQWLGIYFTKISDPIIRPNYGGEYYTTEVEEKETL